MKTGHSHLSHECTTFGPGDTMNTKYFLVTGLSVSWTFSNLDVSYTGLFTPLLTVIGLFAPLFRTKYIN